MIVVKRSFFEFKVAYVKQTVELIIVFLSWGGEVDIGCQS